MTETSGFHEELRARETVKVGSDRTFGLVIGGVLAVLSGLAQWRGHPDRALILAIIAVASLALAVAAPRLLGPVNRAWFRFGMMLNRIVSPVVLAIMFYGAITPVALLMRLRRADPLRLRFERKQASYWIERNPPGPASGTMRNQF